MSTVIRRPRLVFLAAAGVTFWLALTPQPLWSTAVLATATIWLGLAGLPTESRTHQ